MDGRLVHDVPVFFLRRHGDDVREAPQQPWPRDVLEGLVVRVGDRVADLVRRSRNDITPWSCVMSSGDWGKSIFSSQKKNMITGQPMSLRCASAWSNSCTVPPMRQMSASRPVST